MAIAKNLRLFHNSSSRSLSRSLLLYIFFCHVFMFIVFSAWLTTVLIFLSLSFRWQWWYIREYVCVCVFILLCCVFIDLLLDFINILFRILTLCRVVFFASWSEVYFVFSLSVASKTNRKTLPLFIEDENFLFFFRSPFVVIVAFTKENQGNIGKRFAHTHTHTLG